MEDNRKVSEIIFDKLKDSDISTIMVGYQEGKVAVKTKEDTLIVWVESDDEAEKLCKLLKNNVRFNREKRYNIVKMKSTSSKSSKKNEQKQREKGEKGNGTCGIRSKNR